jgi:hypothetical protein
VSINPKEIAALEMLLEDGRMLVSAWPKSLIDVLEQLRRSSIVSVEKVAGTRSPHVILKNREAIETRLKNISFKGDIQTDSVRAVNIATNGSSKKGNRLPYITLLLVGGSAVGWETEEGKPISWPAPPIKSCLRSLNVDERYPEQLLQPLGDVILVENKDLAINLSEILPDTLRGALIVHYEGWLSARLLNILKRWRYAKLWLLPDLDPVGFANIKRLKEEIPDTGVLLPDLNQEHIRVLGDSDIWKNNFGLVVALLPWMDTQDERLQDSFDMLHRAGAGIEQELLLAIGSETAWHLIER